MTNWLNNLFNNEKLTFSAIAALVFVALSLPQTYHLTNNLPVQTVALVGDCPTPTGLLLHTGVFFVILYFLMQWLNKSKMSNASIARYSFVATLLFLILSTSYVLSPSLWYVEDATDEVGCLNNKGVVIQGVVFLVILFLASYNLNF